MNKDHTDTIQSVLLHAGPLTVLSEGAGLRHVRLGDREILRRIYVAVRNRHWETIPGELSHLSIEDEGDSFKVGFVMRHRRDEIDFQWRGQIAGDGHGTVTFTMDGEAHSTFLRNRIGICILHPINECAGQQCTVEHVTGAVTRGRFPQFIAPDQPFLEMRAVTHEVIPGVRATVRFEGETFEMEDQRNWTDASFKTYCTPLSQPFPVEVERGTRLWQRVTLTVDNASKPVLKRPAGIALSVNSKPVAKLPRIGLGIASHREPLSESEIKRLSALNLAHLRVDLDVSADDCEGVLWRATEEAQAINASLEAAIFLSDAAEDELKRLRALAERLRPPVSAWLVFHRAEKVTAKQWIRLARRHLAGLTPDTKFGAGTNLYFTEINRERPPLDELDLVCYSINPQVHALDDLTLVENLEAQAETVRSARELVGTIPIAVTPVTLKPRFNPHQGPPGFGQPELSGVLPPSVDARQPTLFAAAWTLGSLKYLAESGAASMTFYETTGWRGVMEEASGSRVPELFPSLPGAVFPLYHVLADVGDVAGGQVLPVRSSDPLKVIGFAVQDRDALRLLLANLSPEIQEVKIAGISIEGKVRRLNSDSIEEAARAPERFRMKFSLCPEKASPRLVMEPHEVACIG